MSELQAISPLEALYRDTSAAAAVAVTFGQHDDGIAICDVEVLGELRNWAEMRDLEPPAGFDHDDSDEALGMRAGQWCLQAPLRRHLNRFCWLDDDVALRAPWERTPAFEHLYAANDIQHQARAILVESGDVVGWVGLFWKSGDGPKAQVAKIANGFVSDLKRTVAVRRTERRQHRLLVDQAGALIAADPDAARAFTPATVVQIARMRRRGGYAATSIPMDGERGNATLVLLDPLQPVRIDMRRALTTLQGQVVALVASGHSNSEVAGRLDVSLNTVKYHLKNIYSILGVSNRVELLSLLHA